MMIPIHAAPLPAPRSVYPRPIREIHLIELTTRCNLRCKYCPSPKLDVPREAGGHGRPKVDMEWAVFEQTLRFIEKLLAAGTQGEVALTGIGEPTLHPRLVDAVAALRALLGPARPVTVSTNGLLFTEELAAALQPYAPWVFVSLHRPERAGAAVEVAKKYGILKGVNAGAAVSAMDWAQQVKWFNSHPPADCEYLRAGWAAVLVDGRITQCCVDADGSGVTGTVWDEPAAVPMRPWELCQRCSFAVPRQLKED